MKRFLRSSLSTVLYQTNRLFGIQESGTRILCYHRIQETPEEYMNVKPAAFKQQMSWLRKSKYRTVPLGTFLKGDCPANGIVVTFDDGTRDGYTQAFPVLHELGMTGLIFCIADKIGQSGFLTVKDAVEMKSAGFEFGSHSLTHPHLTKLTSNQKWQEISGSKKKLEDFFGFSVDYFCYPFGEFDEEALHLVRKAGYHGACANTPGANKYIDAFRLRRTEIGRDDTLDDFQKKMAGAYDMLHQALHWVRGKP